MNEFEEMPKNYFSDTLIPRLFGQFLNFNIYVVILKAVIDTSLTMLIAILVEMKYL